MLNIKSNKVYATKKCNVCIGWFKSKKYFLVSRVAVLLVFLLSETKKLVLNKFIQLKNYVRGKQILEKRRFCFIFKL